MLAADIFVVEDERVVALHLRQQLTRLGYNVPGTAASGKLALEQIGKLRPDLVLMDVNLEGGIDGVETAARIRAAYDIPVIYLSAYSEEVLLTRARETRPYGYLVKPFSERELHATVQMALERRLGEQALRESEERLRLALDAAAMATWELGLEERRLLRPASADGKFGPERELLPESWDDFVRHAHIHDRPLLEATLESMLAGQELCEVAFRSVSQNGGVQWLRARGKLLASRPGRERRVIGVVEDITAHRRAEERLRQAATVFEATKDGILILDPDLRIRSANQGYCEMTGCAPETLIQLPLLLEGEAGPTEKLQAIRDALTRTGRWRGELSARRRDGHDFPMLVSIAAVTDEDGTVAHYVAVLTDVTPIRRAEAELQYLTHHDPVTDLPNRLLAVDRLRHAIDRAKRRRDRVALLFLDLNGFKRINDTFGHAIGDKLLRAIGQRVHGCLRAEDTIARFGGDEFLVILEEKGLPETLVRIVERLLATIAQPVELEVGKLSVGASIGIGIFPNDGQSSDELIRAADVAMFAAKKTSRQGYMFHTPAMSAAAKRYLELEQDLRDGLANSELCLHYQPQIAMRTGAVIAVEALVRRRHLTRGLLGAGEIVPIAEKSGFIADVDLWTLRHACLQAKAWLAAGLPPVRVAVNVSPTGMKSGHVLQNVIDALDMAELSPNQLEIEITETALQAEEECFTTLRGLRELGVTVAIDDFGTGYSCLSSLKALPIDRVKIDQAFVRDVPIDENDAAIVEAIIAMTHKLKLMVIAEGVETAEQEEFLRTSGCEEAQGFRFAPPMPAEACASFLTSRLKFS